MSNNTLVSTASSFVFFGKGIFNYYDGMWEIRYATHTPSEQQKPMIYVYGLFWSEPVEEAIFNNRVNLFWFNRIDVIKFELVFFFLNGLTRNLRGLKRVCDGVHLHESAVDISPFSRVQIMVQSEEIPQLPMSRMRC